MAHASSYHGRREQKAALHIVWWVPAEVSGASPLQQEIGLGNGVEHVRELEIQWPGSGTRQFLTNLPARMHITITEGVERFVIRSQQAFPFKSGTAEHHHH